MTTMLNVFISSKMLELKAEREALDQLLPTLDYGDIQLNAWVFEEDQPAADSPIRKQYLKWLKQSELYIGLFWKGYGPATIDEFDHAKRWGIERHIYVKQLADNEKRDSELQHFITQISDLNTGLTSKWFHTTEELAGLVKARLDEWVREYRSGPGGEATARLYQTPAEIIGRDEPLIGRTDHMAGARSHLQQNARLLLQGFSGTGKSRLAAELAAEFTPALWLRAGRNDSDALFEAMARPFNLAEAVAREVDDAKVLVVRQMLARSDLKLLVLDDAWNGSALAEVLKAIPPTLPLLVTSRKRLEVGTVIEVGNLPEAEALDLLRYHAGEYADKDGAADLCKLLGYLAFALRIAGKLLPKRKYTPADLYREIEGAPFDMQLDVTEKGRENVAKLIEVSLRAVSAEARTVFLAFGAFFAPQLTPEMLTLYMGKPRLQYIEMGGIQIPIAVTSDKGVQLDDTPILQSLIQLHDQGLIDRIPAVNDYSVEHCTLHDLAYRYVASQSPNEQRHCAIDACLAYISRYNSPSLPNFAALRPELDGLLEAARWAFEHDRYYVDGSRFADSLYVDGNQILNMQGFYSQVLNLYGWMVRAARNRGNRGHEGVALGNMGLAYFRLGRYAEAINYHQKNLVVAQEIGNRPSEAAALGNLGNTYRCLGRYAEATDVYQQILSIFRESGNQRGEAQTLGNLGIAYLSLGYYAEAIDQYEQALPIFRQIGDRQGEANALGNLGNIYHKLGRFIEAIAHHQQALVIDHEIGNRVGETQDLGNLGNAYRRLGRYTESIAQFQQILSTFQEIGDRQGEANALGNLGNAHNNIGHYEQAITYHQQSLAIAREIGDRMGEGNAFNNLGTAFECQKKYAEASQLYAAAWVIYAQLSVPELATTEANLARVRALLESQPPSDPPPGV